MGTTAATSTLQEDLGTLVTYNPRALFSDTTVDEVAKTLRETDFHHWPVVDSARRLVGILSHRDLAREFSLRTATEQSSSSQSISSFHNRPIGELMTTRVEHVEAEATRREALQCLLEHSVHCVPVTEDGYLIGIVTSSDFLREVSYGELPVSRQPVLRSMTKNVDYITKDSSLNEARRVIRQMGQDHVSVLEGECPLGIISLRSLEKEYFDRAYQGNLADDGGSILPLLTTTPTLRPGERLAKAAATMVEHHVQHVAVVNQSNHLQGVVSEANILRALFETTE
jgi:CBS domain-containing membrane protein